MSIYMRQTTINDGQGNSFRRTIIRRSGEDCGRPLFGCHNNYGHRMHGYQGHHGHHNGDMGIYNGFPNWEEPRQFPGLSNSNFFVKTFSIFNAIGGAFRGLFGR